MGVLRVLGRLGDTEFKWNLETGQGLQLVERIFEESTRKSHYLAFIEGPNGEGVERIRTFDPKIDSIILAPRLVGG